MPNYRYKENEYENLQSISNFFKDILKKDSLNVRFCKIEEIYTNYGKKHKPLKKKGISNVLSCRIVLNDCKAIYVLKLEREKVLLREICNMKNFLKLVDLVSSIIITKNKLIKIFILNILYLQYTENSKRESKNIYDIC